MGKQAHDIGVQKKRRQKLERQRLAELRGAKHHLHLRTRKA